jgi:hypothetical protein
MGDAEAAADEIGGWDVDDESGDDVDVDENTIARFAALNCELRRANSLAELDGTAETRPTDVQALLDELRVHSCVLRLPEGRLFHFQRSKYSGTLNVTTEVVDDGWRQLEGGPWVAKLMRPSRQPVKHATYRNFYVSVGIGDDTPLTPGGQIRFPTVPGAPDEGIVCNIPHQWGPRCKQLVFPLELSKNGCTANEAVINAIECRPPRSESDGGDGMDRLVDDDDDDMGLGT